MEKFYRQELKWIQDIVQKEKDKLNTSLEGLSNLEIGFMNLRKEQLENIDAKLDKVLSNKSKRIEIV